MEATFSSFKISHSAPSSIAQIKDHSLITELPHVQNLKCCMSTRLWRQQRGCGLVTNCAKSGGGSLTEMEAKIKSEQNLDFGIDGKCQEKGEIVEVLECLESEAIMGGDEGKEASDYNRRARIFDKSAQVFQALKEQTDESSMDK